MHRAAFAARIVLGPRDHRDLARDAGSQLAARPAGLVGAGQATAGELGDFLLIVVSVESADQSPPRGQHFARVELDLHRPVFERLAVEPDHHGLQPQVVGLHHPAVGAQADLQRSRVQRHTARGGHRLAVGIGIVHLDAERHRPGDRLSDRDVGLGGAVRPERGGQGFGERQGWLGGLLIAVERLGPLGHILAAESELIPALRIREPGSIIGAQSHWQAARTAARQVADKQRQRDRARLDQRVLGPADRRAHVGQFVLVDADRLAGVDRLVGHFESQTVIAQRRALWHGPGPFAGPASADCHSLRKLGIAAFMAQHQLAGEAFGISKPSADRAAHDLLEMHRLANPHQLAVEHGVHGILLLTRAERHIEIVG